MNIVTIQRINRERIQVVPGDVTQLISFLYLLENSPDVKAFKVTHAEVGLITDLKITFGLGDFTKFTTAFDWSPQLQSSWVDKF